MTADTPADAPDGAPDGPLAGRRIGITADRRWDDQARLFTKRGAAVVHAPTMRTVDLRDDPTLRHVTDELLGSPPSHLVATTGMGMRSWLEAAEAWGERERLVPVLSDTYTVARGAKASSACTQAGIQVDWSAPGETMEEVVAHLRTRGDAVRVALQMFDPDDRRWTNALQEAGAEVVEVPVYRWRLPLDDAPAQALINEVLAGTVDAVTFTSQPAVRNLFRLADRRQRGTELQRGFNHGGVMASCVGPVCAEACREVGIDDPVWPDPARLVAQVRQVTDLLGPARAP